MTESFFSTIERELLAHTVRHSHHEASVALPDFIVPWYNGGRQHEEQLRQVAQGA